MITPHSISKGVARFLSREPPKSSTAVFLSNQDFYSKTIGLVYKKEHFRSNAAEEFAQMIVDYFRSLGSAEPPKHGAGK